MVIYPGWRLIADALQIRRLPDRHHSALVKMVSKTREIIGSRANERFRIALYRRQSHHGKNAMRTLMTTSAMVVLAFTARASAESVFLPTAGPSCHDHSKEAVSLWNCPGPNGWVVSFFDEGNMAGIGFARAKLNDTRIPITANWRGSGKVLGDKVQWLVQSGKPLAAIIRTWRNDPDDKGNDREVQELAIFKLEDRKACQYAKVNARQASANEQAEKLAIDSLNRNCPELVPDRP